MSGNTMGQSAPDHGSYKGGGDLPTGPSSAAAYDDLRAREDAAREDRARKVADGIRLLEPAAHGSAVISQAISMKRIADALERWVTSYDAGRMLREPLYGRGAGDPPPEEGTR